MLRKERGQRAERRRLLWSTRAVIPLRAIEFDITEQSSEGNRMISLYLIFGSTVRTILVSLQKGVCLFPDNVVLKLFENLFGFS
jgi:hypothetical protein